MKRTILSLLLVCFAIPAHALSTDHDICEHATYFSGCSKAWLAVRLVAGVVRDRGCPESVISPEVDTAVMEINHCTRPQGIYDLALAPIKSACAEAAALSFRSRVLAACQRR